MRAGMHCRATGLAWAALAALALAGCAGDSANLLASGAGSPNPAGLTTESAAGTTTESATFDPFSDRPPSDRPTREVIEKPTRAEVLQPGPLPEFSIGEADAPVTIIKYMSLTCPYCRRFQAETFPVLKREYIDTGKVRLIIREFPIGKTSGAATVALRCAPSAKYLQLYEKFLAQQSAWVSLDVRHDAIFRVAQQVGMKRSEYDACVANQSMIDGLKWVKERGRQLGIVGTPNFFIENRLVKRTLGMKEIREMVDPLLATR
jgi:protein-disulfide isomerase